VQPARVRALFIVTERLPASVSQVHTHTTYTHTVSPLKKLSETRWFPQSWDETGVDLCTVSLPDEKT
jgi:hypothetical protein